MKMLLNVHFPNRRHRVISLPRLIQLQPCPKGARRSQFRALRQPFSGDVEPSAPGASGEGMDINQALQEVLKIALASGGLRRGLQEAIKTIEAGEALLCILAQVLPRHEDHSA